MKLTMSADAGRLAEIDLGEPTSDGDLCYFDEADLAATSGNLYLYIDGVEYGSLFFVQKNGRTKITLGQFDPIAEEWVERSTIGPLPEEVRKAES